jgi:hypothetical protein
MNTSDNGKKIKAVYWPDNGCAFGGGMEAKGATSYHLSATYHGDRDEFWIVVEESGVETSRINAKNVTQIVWDNDEASGCDNSTSKGDKYE